MVSVSIESFTRVESAHKKVISTNGFTNVLIELVELRERRKGGTMEVGSSTKQRKSDATKRNGFTGNSQRSNYSPLDHLQIVDREVSPFTVLNIVNE